MASKKLFKYILSLPVNFLILSLAYADEKNSLLVSTGSPLVYNDISSTSVAIIISLLLLFFTIWLYWKNLQNNKKLEEKDAHHRALLESTAAIPWELEVSTFIFTYVGPQVEEVTGFKAEEWYTENFWHDHLHPADRDTASAFCADATARHEDHEFVYRFIKKDGDVIWIRDSVQVIIEDDKPVYLRGFMFDITRQKSVEEKQRKIERHLAEAQNIAHVGSWELDILENDLQWSDETFRIFEIDKTKFKPTYEGFLEVIHPDDRDRVNRVYTESIKNKTPYSIEHRLMMPDGRIKLVNERCDTEYDEKGEPIRSFGTVQDISDRKRTDDAIKTIASAVSSTSGDDFYNDLVTNMAEMFDADFAFIGLLDEHDAMKINTFVVYSHGEIIPNISYDLKGTPCSNVVGKSACAYPNHVQDLFPDDEKLFNLGVDSFVGLPLFSNEGLPVGVIVVMDSKPMKNTTEMEEVLKIFVARTEAELEKKKSNETIQKLSLAVEQSPNIIIITNAEGNIEYVNPAFTTATGYSKNEVLNKNPSIVKSGEMSDMFYKNLWDTIKAGKTWSGEFHNRKSNGELYWNESKISPIKNVQGEITHFLCIQSDITDKKQTEQKLRRSQKMDALGKLTGGIAHDYNNMLNVILGYTELLEMVVDKGGAKDKFSEYIKEIQHATERGSALTRKLLAFSRQEPTQPETVDVNQILLDSQNMLEKTLTARVNLEYKLANQLWPVYLDKGDLEDAILNMCINAMHAMPDGGNLTVATENHKIAMREAMILNLPAGEYVKLTISDSGCGMSEEVMNQIFDPFFTTKGQAGTGLGLAQVYGFVKRAKGAITIDSQVNEGTYISIYFPHNASSNKTENVVEDVVSENVGTESILIVDDEIAICELSKNLLSSKGYQVLVAHNGEEALSVLERNNVDLLLSDVIMPKMDGYKLAAKVREDYPDIKIQLVSGYDDDKVRTEDDEMLSRKILRKPFSASQLFSFVRKILDKTQ